MEQVVIDQNWLFKESSWGHWLDACVPGCVIKDLVSNGLLEDPKTGTNELHAVDCCLKDWDYKVDFDLSQRILESDCVELVFDGLDTVCDVILNGDLILNARNMFIAHRVDIKDSAKPGKNSLEIRFRSPIHASEELAAQDSFTYYLPEQPFAALSRQFLRKAQYAFGNDWAPVLPTIGIWKNVYVEAFNTCRIDDVRVTSNLEPNRADINLDCTIRVLEETDLTIDVKFGEVSSQIKSTFDGSATISIPVSIENPRLWWPRNMGEPNLYNVSVRISSGGTKLDCKSFRTGLRTVELLQQPDATGESFCFKVNSIPVFAKGANWVPPDQYLSDVTPQIYRDSLKWAVRANFNMLRVWGGGIYESDAFYEACDEMGIMVWQDFPFHCAEYPEKEWFWNEIKAEFPSQICRLRNHPSLVLWCGNNENQLGYDEWMWHQDKFYGETIYEKLIPQALAKFDNARPYVPGSPAGGKKSNDILGGDAHLHKVWGQWADIETYKADTPRFCSEFSFQAMPDVRSIKQFVAKETGLRLSGFDLYTHNKHMIGNFRHYYYLEKYFPKWSSFEQFVYLTGIMQGLAFEYAIENWHTNWPATAGALIWQFNDCWPVVGFSILDSYLRPKPSLYIVGRAFADVSLHIDGNRVILMNDLPDEICGSIEIEIAGFDGGRIDTHRADVRIPPFSVGEVCEIYLDSVDKSSTYAHVRLTSKSITKEFIKMFAWPIDLNLPDAMISYEYDGKVLKLKSNEFVPFVAIEADDAQDNFFALVPGVEKTVKVSNLTCVTDVMSMKHANNGD